MTCSQDTLRLDTLVLLANILNRDRIHGVHRGSVCEPAWAGSQSHESSWLDPDDPEQSREMNENIKIKTNTSHTGV